MRSLTVVVIALSLAVVVATPIDAATPQRNTKFCKRVDKLGEGVSTQLATEDLTAEQATDVATGLRKAAKRAPRRVKKAMRTLARAYERIADGDAMDNVVAEDGEKFTVAAAVFAAYYLKQCRGTEVSTGR